MDIIDAREWSAEQAQDIRPDRYHFNHLRCVGRGFMGAPGLIAPPERTMRRLFDATNE
jgi:hypothetical protein